MRLAKVYINGFLFFIFIGYIADIDPMRIDGQTCPNLILKYGE